MRTAESLEGKVGGKKLRVRERHLDTLDNGEVERWEFRSIKMRQSPLAQPEKRKLRCHRKRVIKNQMRGSTLPRDGSKKIE